MSDRPSELLVDDIVDAIDRIQRYTAGMSQREFERDDKCCDAVVRNIEIVGEAANRLSEDFKSQHPDIEWGKIVGLRNRIVHGYFGIDLSIIWQVVQSNLPDLKRRLQH